MFTHHTFIHAEHHVALEATIRNHWVAHEEQVASLYKAALANLAGQSCAIAHSKGIFLSTLRDPAVTVSVATDPESGVYVQLAHLKDHKPEQPPLLTVGQKWAAQNPSSVGTVPTKFW